MRVPVSLHAHERTGSLDSITPAAVQVGEYARRGFGAVGFVGHQRHVDVADDRLAVLSGIEHGAGDGRTDPHVVEFPEVGLRYLAHPRMTWPTDTKAKARAFMDRHGIGAVEKFNAGRQQYRGHLDAVELANDDAHNPLQVGTSYMVVDVDVDRITAPAIVDAIERGDADLVNRRFSVSGKVAQGFALTLNRVRG